MKKILVATITLLLTTTAFAEEYLISKDTHCKVYNISPNDFDNGYGYVTWKGDCVNGYANGHGTVKWYSKHYSDEKLFTYVGDMLNGKMKGKGRFTNHYFDDVYEGDWSGNRMNGKGKATYASGAIYEGDWVNGKKHGKGKLINRDGDVYDGDWFKGYQQGKGKEVYPNGNSYEGDWVKGKYQGKGKYTWANGSTYEGEYYRNWENGFGIMKLVKGDDAITSYSRKGQGYWKDNNYIVQGLWSRKRKGFELECSSESDCAKKKAKKYSESRSYSSSKSSSSSSSSVSYISEPSADAYKTIFTYQVKCSDGSSGVLQITDGKGSADVIFVYNITKGIDRTFHNYNKNGTRTLASKVCSR